MTEDLHQDLHQELHRHAAALRGIAQDLLRDRHAAEDITQQTLQQALSRRDLRPGPLGGWLQRTLVNFARQWRRGERRRTVRHAALLPPDALPEPREVLARREALQAVTNAVLQLEEPYQTTIFLRYFEDLPPRAIAARTGTNVATVKSRLLRGLEMLRARLDRQAADWRAGLVCTFGLALPGAAAGLLLTTGAWLVGTTAKSLAAVGLLGLGGWFVYNLRGDPAPNAVVAPPARTDVARSDRQSAPVAAPESSAERELAASVGPPPPPWLDHPFEFQLEVQVVDDLGLPIQGHRLRLAPDGCALDAAEGQTGADGRLLLTWRGRRSHGRVAIEDADQRLHRLELDSGKPAFFALGGHQGPTLNLEGVQITWAGETTRVGERLLTRIAHGRPAVSASASDLTMRAGLHPFAVFVDNAAQAIEVESAAGPDMVIRLSNSLSRLSTTLGFALGDASTAAAATVPVIAGTVFGDDGKPAAKVPVCAFADGPQPLARATTDEQGQFHFEDLSAGHFTLRAGGGPQGLATSEVAVTEGTTPASLQLQRGACVRGRVVDASGAPLADAKLTWQSLDGRAWDATSSESDGTFVFANQPGGPGRVLVWPSDTFALPLAMAASVLPDTGEVKLVCDTGGGGSLQLDVLTPANVQAGQPQVRVWQLDTGASTTVPRPAAGKPWSLAHLPAGWYQVEVRERGFGFVDAGRHWIDGKGLTDLGSFTLPQPGSAHFDLSQLSLPNEAPTFEVCALRPDLDLRLALDGPFPEGDLQLPIGDYVFFWLGRDGKVGNQRFAVRASERTLVEVAPH